MHVKKCMAKCMVFVLKNFVRRGREGNAETRGKKTVRGEHAADEQQALPDCLRDAYFPLAATQPCGCEWSVPNTLRIREQILASIIAALACTAILL